MQEMAFFSWIQGMFDASNLAHGVAAVAKEIDLFGKCGWDDGHGKSQCAPGPGTLMHRWASSGFYNAPWGPMNDQTPNFILAVHGLALASGDRAWLASQLAPLEAIAGYMLGACGVGTGGVFVDPGASGLPDGGRHCANWFDIIEFGHQVSLRCDPM